MTKKIQLSNEVDKILRGETLKLGNDLILGLDKTVEVLITRTLFYETGRDELNTIYLAFNDCLNESNR